MPLLLGLLWQLPSFRLLYKLLSRNHCVDSQPQFLQTHGLAPMGGKAKGVGKRGIGSSKSRKTHKQGLRAQFESRHLDQVWEDVRKAVAVHDGKTAPVGTTDKAQLDEDLPAHGQHYCIPCSRYFVSENVLLEHEKTKPHKRRVKSLFGAKPHTKKDADKAAGMGAPDNGKRPAVEVPVIEYDTEAVGTGVRGLEVE